LAKIGSGKESVSANNTANVSSEMTTKNAEIPVFIGIFHFRFAPETMLS